MNSTPSHEQDPDRPLIMPSLSDHVPPSAIADRYELRDLLGSGTGGKVFEAYDRVLGRLVALKLMPVEEAGTPEVAERLRRFQFEAQSVSRLSHPHIITIHDFGQTGGFAWIVMELIIGETLKATLRQQGRLPLADSVRLITALLAALDCAHERGIVHRDVKPENILIEMSRTQDIGELRLSDFGVARIVNEERTITGEMIGTPSVMAPEQLRGESGDARIDIWAAGVVLYEMLLGERPFKGNLPGLFHSIQTVTPTPPTTLRPDLPPAFDAVIARALAKRPEDRFSSAREMAEAVCVAQAAAEAPSPLDATPPPDLDVPTEAAVRRAFVASKPAHPLMLAAFTLLVFLGGVISGFVLAGR